MGLPPVLDRGGVVAVAVQVLADLEVRGGQGRRQRARHRSLDDLVLGQRVRAVGAVADPVPDHPGVDRRVDLHLGDLLTHGAVVWGHLGRSPRHRF